MIRTLLIVSAGLALTACVNVSTTERAISTPPAKASLPFGGVELEAVTRIERISDFEFEETLSRLRAELNARQNIRIISTVDHMRNASSVGKTTAPNTVITFGNPRAGTELMNADPRIGLHLPLKMQVYETNGEVRLAYQDIDSLARRFEISPDEAPVANVRATLDSIAKKTTRAQ